MKETKTGGISLLKTGIVAILLLFLVILIIQNLQPLLFRVLFFQVALPGAVLVLVPFLLGAVVAMVVTARKARSSH